MSRFSGVWRFLAFPSPREVLDDIKDWLRTQGPWWATSVTAHAVLLSTILLLLGTVGSPREEGEPVTYSAASIDTTVPEPLDETFVDVVTTDTPSLDVLDLNQSPTLADAQLGNSISEIPTENPGIEDGIDDATRPVSVVGGFDPKEIGSGPSSGHRENGLPGPGQNPFGPRDWPPRKGVRGSGDTTTNRSAVGRSLRWLAAHQNTDGSWSLDNYQRRCKDASCTGKGSAHADAAATALGLLPFLAAGQTHRKAGPYKSTVNAGLYWLLQHQKSDGNLAADGAQVMYSHGLATIALCEAFGMTKDQRIGNAAQAAVHFIESAQNQGTGGWRYQPGDPGDTSVWGWQVMALKSAQMAGLSVNSQSLANSRKWLKAIAQSTPGLFSYEPAGVATPAMSAVALLGDEYLGAPQNDPTIVGGVGYLMANLPDGNAHNAYYWYYATQVMHNLPGKQWDDWNRKMRKILVDTQTTKGCAAGSWDPAQPAMDAWGEPGGRLMVTSLSCLTLEVYYRYLPLYQLDKTANAPGPQPVE